MSVYFKHNTTRPQNEKFIITSYPEAVNLVYLSYLLPLLCNVPYRALKAGNARQHPSLYQKGVEKMILSTILYTSLCIFTNS